MRYPGRYTFKQGDTLTEVIDRAGGLTDQAFPQGSVFLREDLREREQEQLEALRTRLQNDISLLAFRSAGSVEGGSNILETQRGWPGCAG